MAFDENVPRALLRVMEALVEAGEIEGFEFCSAKKYSPGPGAKTDIPWVQAFAKDGGEVLISGERMMRSIPEVKAAIREAGVKAYYLPPEWNHWRMERRVAFILAWWEKLVEHFNVCKPGDAWIVPPAWLNGTLKQVTDGERT